jgi:hypothetical protein
VPPIVLPARVAALVCLSLAVGSVAFAVAGTPVRPVIAQKQLVSRTNCQTAAYAASSPDFVSKSVEYRDDVHITTRYCSATAHNQLAPTKPQIVVVGADPAASGEDKIFFKTIPLNDAKKVHDTCVLAGKATFVYSQAAAATAPQTDAVIVGADVLTDSGKVDCEDFVRATAADNPLVVLAPGVLSGTAISVPILNMIGHKRPATEVQAEIDNLGHQVAGSVAMSADEIRKHPQIIFETDGPNLRPAPQ